MGLVPLMVVAVIVVVSGGGVWGREVEDSCSGEWSLRKENCHEGYGYVMGFRKEETSLGKMDGSFSSGLGGCLNVIS